jgi:uncharacterized protein YndB with AHSA1/START domain
MTDAPAGARELVLVRHLQAPRAAVWRCWTEPELLEQWFAPAPWSVADVTVDLRPGGAFEIVMRSPEGEEHPGPGCYLEIEPPARLVFTDAFIGDWQPSEKPFFTAVLTFEDATGGTRYTARARHWSDEDRAAHEAMGFHDGWGKCADQLEALARSLG